MNLYCLQSALCGNLKAMKTRPGLPANYHTHTTRCRHASGTDREYVERAVSEGFAVLGFSDHTPWPYGPDDFTARRRMDLSQLPEYLISIRSLKEEFKDRIDIKVGLEAEYFPQYMSWLKDTIEEQKLDYVLLGNHYWGHSESFEYYGYDCTPAAMRHYVDDLPKALETGLFMYVAHPDLMFSEYPSFDDNCISATRDIIAIAKQAGVPLEYNISGTWKRFRGLGYPTALFWEKAAECSMDVYLGFDAHEPFRISRKLFDDTASKLRAMGLNVLNA